MTAKTEQVHTPTPWKQGTNTRTNTGEWILIYTEGSKRPIAKILPIHTQGNRQAGDFDEEQANLAFIVKACNAHDDLVKSLTFLSEAVRTEPCMEIYRAHIEQARDILDKVKA